MRRSDATKYVLDQETGKYDYIGTRYQVMATEADYRLLKRGGMAASFAMLACFVACGLFTYGGMNCNYVVLPYVLLMLPLAWLLSRFIKLWNKKQELTEAGNRLLMHIRWSSLTASALGGLASVAQGVFSALHGWVQGDAVFIALMALCIPMGVAVFLLVRRCPTEVLLIDDLPEEMQE